MAAPLFPGSETAGTSDDPGTMADGRLPDDPGYMAPEQISADFVDARADVFALGVIAYEMLIGRNPFWAGEGAPPGTVVYRIVYRPYPEIAPGVIPGLTDGVRAVITAAMAKDARTRFADAQSFLEALVGARSSFEGAAPGRGRRGCSVAGRESPLRGRSRRLGLRGPAQLGPLLRGGEHRDRGSGGRAPGGSLQSASRRVPPKRQRSRRA